MAKERIGRILFGDGTLLTGLAVGHSGTQGGECCFNTAMTGYQEVHTDPSYCGQIIFHTASHIGNYGVLEAGNTFDPNSESQSSSPKVQGVVLNEDALASYRPGAISLDAYLKKHRIVGVSGIDIRWLMRRLRSGGEMNAVVCTDGTGEAELAAALARIPTMRGLCLADQVTGTSAYDFGSSEQSSSHSISHSSSHYKVAVWDLGIKSSIIACLIERGVSGRVFPATATLAELQAYGADGYLISNGPGDPAAMTDYVAIVQELVAENKPLLGICLGHQLLGRAFGIETYKLPHGHRGANHSVFDHTIARGLISSQNHGFSLKKADTEACEALEITHTHLNDGTVAGIRVKGRPIFSVQFHPEAGPGPHDGRYILDSFVTLLAAWKGSQQ